MRCRFCNERLAPHDLWCVKCGKRTEVLNRDLSATKSLNESWKKFKPLKGQNLPVGIVATLTGIIPLIILIWVLNYAFPFMAKLGQMSMHIIVWTFFIPVLVVPFREVCRSDGYTLTTKAYMSSFKAYGQYLVFSFISVVFYVTIFFVCKGDPILNLVWLVLVLYWVAIALPVPVLMQRYQINAWEGIRISYKRAGDVRWNIFLMVIILFITNVLAAAALVIMLAVTIPFTWFAIRDYVDKLIEFEVFESKVGK